jgi:hypothetical protein
MRFGEDRPWANGSDVMTSLELDSFSSAMDHEAACWRASWGLWRARERPGAV